MITRLKIIAILLVSVSGLPGLSFAVEPLCAPGEIGNRVAKFEVGAASGTITLGVMSTLPITGTAAVVTSIAIGSVVGVAIDEGTPSAEVICTAQLDAMLKSTELEMWNSEMEYQLYLDMTEKLGKAMAEAARIAGQQMIDQMTFYAAMYGYKVPYHRYIECEPKVGCGESD